GFGAKPYLTKLTTGHYALLQTNEHDTTDRTNAAVFLTDEAGFRRNSWRLGKVMTGECREHWLGSACGWLAEDPRGGIHSVWVSFVGQENHLNYAHLSLDWLLGTVIEPLAPADNRGDDLPRLKEVSDETRGLSFPTLRSRAHAAHLGSLEGSPYRVSLSYLIESLDGEFTLLDLRASHGRHPWLRVELRSCRRETASRSDDAATSSPDENTGRSPTDAESKQMVPRQHQVWVNANGETFDSGVRVGKEVRLVVEVLGPREAWLRIDDNDLGRLRSVTAC